MKTNLSDEEQARLFEALLTVGADAPAPAPLDPALAALAAAAPPGPTTAFVQELASRLAAAPPASAERWHGVRLPSLHGARMRAAAIVVSGLLVVGGTLAWQWDSVLSQDRPPDGVAKPVVFPSLADAQAAVIFPLVSPPPGYKQDWVRWYCVKFRDLPCSPQAAWVEARFAAPDGRAFILKQGYFGMIAMGTVSTMLPADRKGEITIGTHDGYWIDCRGDAGAKACSTKDAMEELYATGTENYAATQRIAAVAWLATKDGNGSERSVGLESDTLSPQELADIGAALVPLADGG